MATYQTKQKRAVMDFMHKGHDNAYTIEEIIEGLYSDCNLEDRPGKSTIYRIVSGLVQEGYIRRQIKEGSKQFAYQIASFDCEGSHLHLKCTGCGQLIHMGEDVSANILVEVLKDRGFSIDEEQTVIMGRCSDCQLK